METSDWLLIAGAGIAIWYFLTPATAAAATSATPATPATPAPATAAAEPTEAQVTLALLQAMGPTPILAAARNSGQLPGSQQLNVSQWNYWMSTVSGVLSPDLTAYDNGIGNNPMTLSAYWSALMNWASVQAAASLVPAAGVSGLSGLGAQPGRGVNNFPPPGSNETGRYDMSEMGWA